MRYYCLCSAVQPYWVENVHRLESVNDGAAWSCSVDDGVAHRRLVPSGLPCSTVTPPRSSSGNRAGRDPIEAPPGCRHVRVVIAHRHRCGRGRCAGCRVGCFRGAACDGLTGWGGHCRSGVSPDHGHRVVARSASGILAPQGNDVRVGYNGNGILDVKPVLA